ncbi:hypothetical protein MWH25_03105 [Natroniella acetigena]|uniref:hypothetical protein n=1 Tax=Natroniella acetigena TaxID=52004 RepID=UPI00200B2114|nr:hypothetical protein [Natroniella acetigena]MCK8826732.1 hypothetical protein [Natroniella acetigena]
MSMPKIPKRDQEGALIDLLESVALEEAALAHLINAEAEKAQKIAKDCNVTAQEMIEFQKSISKVMKNIIKKEMLLQFKLEDILEFKKDSKDKLKNDCGKLKKTDCEDKF